MHRFQPGGGGELVPYKEGLSYCLIVDSNGYIGDKQEALGATYYATLISGADYSDKGLGQITLLEKPEQLNVEIGGKTYNAVKINDITYLADNLDLKWNGLLEGSSNAGNGAITYYNNNESIYGWNGQRRGGLYDGVAVNYLDAHKDELIPGWHVITNSELNNLLTIYGSTVHLRGSINLWKSGTIATDISNWNAYPHGDYNGGWYDLQNSLTLRVVNSNNIIVLSYDRTTIFTYSSGDAFMGSVRLVKDN